MLAALGCRTRLEGALYSVCRAADGQLLLAVSCEALCDAAEIFWKTRVQPGTAGEVCSGVLRCAAAFTAAADYLGKNCAGGESFTVGDVTVKGMTGQSAQALADGLRQSAERLMAPYAVSGTFCFKGVRG